MNLNKKRELAARTLNIGKDRIIFNIHRLDEIKDSLTKQDIRDLLDSGAIMLRDKKGAKKIVRRKSRRHAGSIRMKVRNRKAKYVMLTRKLRSYIYELKRKENLSKENYMTLRKEIRAKIFKDKVHLNERIKSLK